LKRKRFFGSLAPFRMSSTEIKRRLYRHVHLLELVHAPRNGLAWLLYSAARQRIGPRGRALTSWERSRCTVPAAVRPVICTSVLIRSCTMTPKTTAAGRGWRKAGRKRSPPSKLPPLSSGVPNSTFRTPRHHWGVTRCPTQVPAFCSALEQSRARQRKFLNVAKWGREATLVPLRGENARSSLLSTSCHERIKAIWEKEKRRERKRERERERTILNDCFGLFNVLCRTCYCTFSCTEFLIAGLSSNGATFFITFNGTIEQGLALNL